MVVGAGRARRRRCVRTGHGDPLPPGAQGGWPIYGEPAFPGLVLLVLAPIGVVAGWRDRARRSAVVAGLALVLVGLALGLGAGPSGWRRFAPYRLLFEYVPGWEALRATGRAWVVGLLGVGLLAGIGTLALGRWLARRAHWSTRTTVGVLAAVAIVGLLVEGYAPWTSTDHGTVDVAVSPVDEHLAALGPGGVLYLPALEQGAGPVREALSGFRQAENVYGTTAHHRITPNGYSGYFPPSWKRLSREVEHLPDDAALARLRSLDVRYVVVRDWADGTVWEPLRDRTRAAPLRYLGTYGGDVLYEVPAGAS
jgi:hypothetical protein